MQLYEFAMLILLTQFVISETRRRTKDHLRDLELKVTGRSNLYPLEKFDGVKYPIDPETISIYIKNMEIEPSNILEAFEHLKVLERLELKNVAWSGNFTRKLYLPRLKYFHLRRVEWDSDLSTKEELFSVVFIENYESLTEIRVEGESELGDGRVIYFPQEQRLILEGDAHDLYQYWPHRDLDITDCTLDISVFNGTGVKRFSGTRIQGLKDGNVSLLLQKLDSVVQMELYSNVSFTLDLNMLPSPKGLKSLTVQNGHLTSSSSEIFQLPNLLQLVLQNSSVNLSSVSLTSPSLKSIEVSKVNFIGGSVRNFFLANTNLTFVKIVGSGHKYDLSVLLPSASSILDLHLQDLEPKLCEAIQFDQLERLNISHCTFDMSLLGNFSQVFQYVHHVIMEGHGNVVSKELLSQILNTRAERLTFNGFTYWDRSDVTEFVTSAGAPTYLDHIGMLKVNGTWKIMEQPKGIRYNTNVRDLLVYAYALTLFITCILGILGTLTSMIVLVQKSMRSSTSCLLFALASYDTLVLVSYIPSILMSAVAVVIFKLGFELYYNEYYFFGMKFTIEDALEMDRKQRFLFYPLSKTAYTGSVLATVLLTLERYVAVCWPLKAKSWITVRKAIVASLGVLIVTILLNVPRWFEGDESLLKISTEHGQIVEFKRVYKRGTWLRRRLYMEYYQGWIWVTFVYVIPVTILSTLNLRIWNEVRSSSARRRQMSRASRRQSRVALDNDDDLRGITKMLLTVVAVFLACSLLSAAIFLHYFGIEPMSYESLACFPLIMNSSVNFLIYTITGDKFRRNLVAIFPRFCQEALYIMYIRPMQRKNTATSRS